MYFPENVVLAASLSPLVLKINSGVNWKTIVLTKKKKIYIHIETIVIHYFHELEARNKIVLSTKPSLAEKQLAGLTRQSATCYQCLRTKKKKKKK